MPVESLARPSGCNNFKLRQLMRRFSQHYDAELGNSGLKATQYSLLSHIAQLGPIRPGELAHAMAIDASTLTRNLKPLAAAGWITVAAASDARSHTRIGISNARPVQGCPPQHTLRIMYIMLNYWYRRILRPCRRSKLRSHDHDWLPSTLARTDC